MQQRKIEWKIIDKISHNVEIEKINERDVIKTCGSLYSLFNSQYFDMNFILYYLEKNDDVGITDMLINKIYERFVNDSVFYIPQLWYVFIYI